jgi:putative SOS response-associated peptidase YedK
MGSNEWTRQAKKRHPYDFRLNGKKLFALAGLWSGGKVATISPSSHARSSGFAQTCMLCGKLLKNCF